MSALYRLQFWLDSFHIYTSYQATSEGVSHVKLLAKFLSFNFFNFFKFFNFDLVLFWLGIWCESLVWVIMERRGVSQNAGVLVVLVLTKYGLVYWQICALLNLSKWDCLHWQQQNHSARITMSYVSRGTEKIYVFLMLWSFDYILFAVNHPCYMYSIGFGDYTDLLWWK